MWLKQSTAFTFRLGPFVDATDGVTAETGLTLSQADYRLSKAGGAFAQKNETTSGTHNENGWYTCILDATDTNTLGTLDIAVHESGALPVFTRFLVLPANVYDSMVAGTDTLDVQVTGIGANVITATSINADAITAAKVAADVTTEIQSGLATAAALDAVDNFLDTEIADIQARLPAALVSGRIDASVGAMAANVLTAAATAADFTTEIQTGLATQASVDVIDGIVDSILVDTAEIGAAGAGLTNINLPNQTMDIVGNITGNLSGSVGSVTGLTVAHIDAAISSRASQTSLDTVDDFLDTEVAAILAAVDTEVAAIKAKTDLIPAAPAAVGDIPTAVQNADALLDRNMATGTDSGSTSIRTPRQALRFLRNKWDVAAGTLTVNKEDDTTASWTAAMTATAGADPITGSNPAGP